jgi:dihydrofolate reductase
MARVIAGMMVSLDGYVNDREGGLARLYPDMAAIQDSASWREQIAATGAVVMGRRAYELAGGDYTGYEFQVPIVVVTHRAPERAARGENERLTFAFETGGVASAIARAGAAAGERQVTIIGGPSIIQQALRAGLVDELHLEIRPVLLGGGLPLFAPLDTAAIDLERIAVLETPLTTELRFRVNKP